MKLYKLLAGYEADNARMRVNFIKNERWNGFRVDTVSAIAEDEAIKDLEVLSFHFEGGMLCVSVAEETNKKQTYVVSTCSSAANGVPSCLFYGTEEELIAYMKSLVREDRDNDPGEWEEGQEVSVEKTGPESFYTCGQYRSYHIDYEAMPLEYMDIVEAPKPDPAEREEIARKAVTRFYDTLAKLPKPESYNVGGTYYGGKEFISRVGNDLRIITGDYTEYGYAGLRTNYYDVYACKIGGAYGYRKEEKELVEKLKNLLTDSGSDYAVIYDVGTNFSVIGIGARHRKEVAS